MQKHRLGAQRFRPKDESIDTSLQFAARRFGLASYRALPPGVVAAEYAPETITSAAQATNSTTSRVLAPNAVRNVHLGEQISNDYLPNIGGLQGDVPLTKLPNIPAYKLPNVNALLGKINRANLESNIAGDFLKNGTVAWAALASAPPFIRQSIRDPYVKLSQVRAVAAAAASAFVVSHVNAYHTK